MPYKRYRLRLSALSGVPLSWSDTAGNYAFISSRSSSRRGIFWTMSGSWYQAYSVSMYWSVVRQECGGPL